MPTHSFNDIEFSKHALNTLMRLAPPTRTHTYLPLSLSPSCFKALLPSSYLAINFPPTETKGLQNPRFQIPSLSLSLSIGRHSSIPTQKLHMGKKQKSSFTSLFKPRDKAPSFPWPSCKHPRTHSFRGGLYSDSNSNHVLKTMNSVYLDVTAAATPESTWFTNSSSESAGSVSTAASDQEDHDQEEQSSGAESLETVMRGVKSGRFFFEPAGDTKSILDQEAKETWPAPQPPPFEESVVTTLESEDPFTDFRVSMEEMVEAHGLRDWECLEELLKWYLRVNGKKNHGFIVGAFVDLLIRLVLASAAALEGVGNTEITEISPSD